MSRIGLTQRVSVVEAYEERRDCLDQRWAPLLESLGHVPLPLPNTVDDVDLHLSSLDLDAIVVTGGNDVGGVEGATDVAPERDAFESALLSFARREELPVLGICRGAQFLNLALGGTLSPVEGHVDSPHNLAFSDDAPVILDGQVNSYHSHCIHQSDLANSLAVIALAPDGTVEWVEHESEPLAGVMWHPERPSPSPAFDRHVLTTYLGSETP